jgi:hypothetical protein
MDAWVREMNSRSDEVSETLRNEGVTLELVMLEEAADGDYLLFLLETDDYDRAVRIFTQSKLPVDEYHRRFLAENIVGREHVRVLSCHAA